MKKNSWFRQAYFFPHFNRFQDLWTQKKWHFQNSSVGDTDFSTTSNFKQTQFPRRAHEHDPGRKTCNKWNEPQKEKTHAFVDTYKTKYSCYYHYYYIHKLIIKMKNYHNLCIESSQVLLLFFNYINIIIDNYSIYWQCTLPCTEQSLSLLFNILTIYLGEFSHSHSTQLRPLTKRERRSSF